ncbi:hypothetical protein ACFOOM_28040 [Streptomyces echinoruber]|uniref:NodB homology domain-containing protein n=1 Tax=Streptomyces echinoruber TaxID=68898 RepID=A0A918RT65_9ACTN|nr:hypothetical protein [Streptomyces echinoruber]GHA11836.1 hypothetical protein GCM10010389_58600 [Streptomyces echinoruber]
MHPPVATDRVPGAALRGGPLIDPTGTPVRSHALPDRTVALTFDDGPDPTCGHRGLAAAGRGRRRRVRHREADRSRRRGAVARRRGDRFRTVRALELLIPELRVRGYRFTTITEALGAGRAHHPATGTELWGGRAFVAAVAVTAGSCRPWRC